MSIYTIGWLLWIAWFFLEEGIGLFRKESGSTLSEHVWAWFSISARSEVPSTWVRIRRIALLSFLAWLTVHFLTGGTFV
mgnify:CR=1 FL=1